MFSESLQQAQMLDLVVIKILCMVMNVLLHGYLFSINAIIHCGGDKILFSVEFPVSLSTSRIYRGTQNPLQFSLLF